MPSINPLNAPISRRRLMKMSAGALLAAGLWPRALRADEISAPAAFPFICVNDLNVVDDGCVPFFTMVVKKMKESSPESKLVLVVGVLCDNCLEKQHAAIRDVLGTTGL